jgi:poly(3-hydroxyalkanoate) synthetase
VAPRGDRGHTASTASQIAIPLSARADPTGVSSIGFVFRQSRSLWMTIWHIEVELEQGNRKSCPMREADQTCFDEIIRSSSESSLTLVGSIAGGQTLGCLISRRSI